MTRSISWHGTVGGYSDQGCRCPRCKRAQADAAKARRSRIAEKRVDGMHPDAPHGTTGGYVNWSCRCAPCRDALNAYRKELRDRRFAERILIDGRLVHLSAKHGTRCGYMWFGCRCSQCTGTENSRQADRRAKGLKK